MLQTLQTCALIFAVLLPVLAAGQDKQLVVVHYANKTSPAGRDGQNYYATINRLTEIGTAKALAMAKNLSQEPELM